jgi:tetratricopeptide (TPR) repeat protein
LFLAFAVASASISPSAWAAEPADAAAASDEKKKGDESFDRLRFSEALEHYQAALTKGGDARLHYNIAQVFSALGRFPEALVSYQQFLTDAPRGILNEEQQKQLFQLIEEVKGKITRVEVRCDVKGARVLVRGVEAGTAPLAQSLSVNSGPAKIEVIAEGYRPFVATIELPGGGAQVIEAKLERIDFSGTLLVRTNLDGALIVIDGEARGPSPLTVKLPQGAHTLVARAPEYLEQTAAVTIEAGQKQETSLTLRRAPSYTLAYVGLGVAVAGIGIGTASGLAAYSNFKKDDCDATTRLCGPASHAALDTSKLYGNIATASFVVGGTGAALGVYWWLKARRQANGPSVGVGLGPGQVFASGQF